MFPKENLTILQHPPPIKEQSALKLFIVLFLPPPIVAWETPVVMLLDSPPNIEDNVPA